MKQLYTLLFILPMMQGCASNKLVPITLSPNTFERLFVNKALINDNLGYLFLPDGKAIILNSSIGRPTAGLWNLDKTEDNQDIVCITKGSTVPDTYNNIRCLQLNPYDDREFGRKGYGSKNWECDRLKGKKYRCEISPLYYRFNLYGSNEYKLNSRDKKRFIEKSNDTIIDKKQNLQWMTCPVGQNSMFGIQCLPTLEKKFPPYVQEAHEFVKKFNKTGFAGFNDWRLPTDDELMSIVNCKREVHRFHNSCEDRMYTLASDPVFKGVRGTYLTTNKDYGVNMWSGEFQNLDWEKELYKRKTSAKKTKHTLRRNQKEIKSKEQSNKKYNSLYIRLVRDK